MNAEPGYLLVVEDDPDILKLLDTTLTFRGYRVVTARNGREGLEIIRKQRPAIIIADIMMPGLDGFGLVHRLRIDRETRDIPVIFITATYVTPEDREFALSIGATRFVEKPIDLEDFLRTIAELLKRGKPLTLEPLKEFNFYEGYQRRLEKKLNQKNKQIARAEELIRTRPGEKNEALQASLHQDISDRDEIKLLLVQINEQLRKYAKPEEE
jgi:CheY-like chemotaxis protein